MRSINILKQTHIVHLLLYVVYLPKGTAVVLPGKQMGKYKWIVCLSAVVCVILGSGQCQHECPYPWFYYNTNKSECICSKPIDTMITCDEENNQTYVHRGTCVAANRIDEHNMSSTIVAVCPYLFPQRMFHGDKIPLPRVSSLNDFICHNLSRNSDFTLCGHCRNGTGPAIYSVGSQCVECSFLNILWYILLQYVPTTLLFIAVVIYQVNVAAAPMAHYILFCNIVAIFIRSNTRLYTQLFYINKAIHIIATINLTICGLWSSDFLRFVAPTLCISEYIQDIQLLLFDMAATLYPLLLLLLMYILQKRHGPLLSTVCKPLTSVRKFLKLPKIRNISFLHAFSTFFYLSFARLLFLSGALLVAVTAQDQTQKWRRELVYVDPTVEYFSKQHVPYVAVSLLVILLVLIPTVVLMLYPFRRCQLCLNRLCSKPWVRIATQTFVDTFHGCYKDGTNGSRDYRPASGVTMLAILAGGIIIAVPVKSDNIDFGKLWHTYFVLCLILAMSTAIAQPYKTDIANASGTVIAAILAILCDINSTDSLPIQVMLLALLSFPHVVFASLIVYNCVRSLRNRIVRKMQENQPLLAIHK